MWTFITNVPTIHAAVVRGWDAPHGPHLAGIRAGRADRMRIALCNEVIAAMPFERQCAFARSVGYDGIEIAPFTLTDEPT